MANGTDEDYFDITPSTPRITQQSPWQNRNPFPSGAQHVVGSGSSHMNGYQNLGDCRTTDANDHLRHLKSDIPTHGGSLGVQGLPPGNVPGESLETWDPMGDDYSCPTFNCYKSFDVLASELPKQRSPKSSVKSPDKQSVPEDISLYVANIPIQMTQEGLRNLFQRAGKVCSCCLLAPTDPSQERRIGFVTFQSWKEALKAIECYNGFSLGNNIKLRVKVANKEGRHNIDILAEDDDYGSSQEINSNGIDGCASSTVNGLKERRGSVDESGNSFNGEFENNSTNSMKNEQVVVSQTSNGTNSSSPSGASTEVRPCTKCLKLCTQRCSACKAPYCSVVCQKADRVNHKAVCSYKGSTKKPTSTTSKPEQPEHYDPVNDIDFDCIDISVNDHTDYVKKADKPDQVANEPMLSKDEVNSQMQILCRVSEIMEEPSRKCPQLPPAPSLVPNVFRLLVTTVASGNSFWAQVVDDQFFPRFVDTTKEMTVIGETSLERVTRPDPGICCLARFSLDGSWYRSKIEQVTDDNKVEVFFVDYGNKEWKDSQEVYHMPSQFSCLPAQARLFALSSVKMSQNLEVQRNLFAFLDGLVSGKAIDAEVVSVIPGCTPEVVMSEAGSQQTVNEMVMERQVELESSFNIKSSLPPNQAHRNPNQSSHSEPATMSQDPLTSGVPQDVTSRPTTPCDLSGFKVYMASEIANEPLPSQKTFDIFVTEIFSPTSFWIQLPEAAIEKLNLLAAQLDASYKESDFSDYVPSVGELIVAKFTDQLFYRAKVDCIYNDGTLKVTFVDFGNSEDVHLYDVRRITPELVIIPKLAIKCSLIGVESSSKAGNWPVECISLCKTLMLNKRCTASAEGHLHDSVLLRVWGSSHPNEPLLVVNDELVTKGYAKSTKQEVVHNNVEQGHCASGSAAFVENGKQQVENYQASPFAAPSHVSYPDPLVPTEGKNVKPQHGQLGRASLCVTPHAIIDEPPNFPLVENQPPPYPTHYSPGPFSVTRRPSSGSCQSVVSSRSQTPEAKSQPALIPGNEHRRSLPLPDIPSNAFDVVVNEVISGDQFYAQMIDPQLVCMLHKCVRELNQFCKNPQQSAAVNVQVGSLGCAKFTWDNVWYRAQVISVEKAGYRVRFVDFGNTEVVEPKDFHEPPDFFYELAPQALCCRLEPTDRSAGSWGERSKDVLLKLTSNKRLSCTAVATTCSPYPVKLELCSGGQRINLAKELQKDLSYHPSSEVTSPSRRNSSSSGEARSRSSFSELILGPAITSAAIGNHGDKYELLVTEVSHPTYFWAQLALRSNIEDLNRLTEDLNAHYSTTRYPPFQGEANTFCACKFSLDSTWYRGFVKSESPKGIVVHFVDFGNSEMTTAEMLRPLESQFMAHPFRAILCSMACVEPAEGKFWSKEAIEHFKRKVTGVVLKCTVIANSKSRLFLDIQDPESQVGQSLQTNLVENGMAKAVGGYSLSFKNRSFSREDQPGKNNLTKSGQKFDDGKLSGEPSESAIRNNSVQRNSPGNFRRFNHTDQSFDDGKSFAASSSLGSGNSLHQDDPLTNLRERTVPYDKTPSTSGSDTSIELVTVMASSFSSVAVDTQNPVRVLVTDVSSPQEIYFQVVKAECYAGLNSLSENMNSQFANTKQSYTPIPGELCCALFSVDNCWYRVVVCNVNVNTELAAVQFIDYGNRDNVPFSSLRPIHPSLTKLPFQARQATLAGLSFESAAWTPHRVACLRTVLFGKPLMAKVVREVRGVLEMEFYDTSGESDILVNALFIEQGYPVPEPQPAGVPTPSFSKIPEAIPTETDLEVVVTEVNDPECFWVQNIIMDSVNQFATMTQQMNSLCKTSRESLPTINIGDVCCCKFACDGQWYRARVEAFLGNGLVRVVYVDFGNREEVDPSGLKPLNQAFIHFPVQGLQCKLANVQPANGPWSVRAIEWLKSQILGKRLYARVVGRMGSVLQLELIDTSNPDRDVFINSEMVQTGEAKMA